MVELKMYKNYLRETKKEPEVLEYIFHSDFYKTPKV